MRVYNGSQTQLPRHYVARQRLCLRATTDYWVNAMDGQPFFVVNQVVDPGLIQVVEHEVVTMDLAERGTCLRNGLWVRELRKCTERGHQTAILCTDYRSAAAPSAMAMFARWSQENFFKYAREHFGLDRLVDYRTESISDPLRLVNPDYRNLDGQVRSTTGKLTRRLAQFAAMTLQEPIEPKHVEPFVRRKAKLQEEVQALQHELGALKTKRKETPHHVTLDELPEEARFRQLSTRSKHLVDRLRSEPQAVAADLQLPSGPVRALEP